MASGVPRELIAGSSFYSFRGSDGYEGPPFPITTKLETLMKGWHINALYNTNGFYNAYIIRDSLNMDKLVLVIGLFSWSFSLSVHLRHAGEQSVSLLLVLPQCDLCSPAWRFCTTRVASCKRPFKLIV